MKPNTAETLEQCEQPDAKACVRECGRKVWKRSGAPGTCCEEHLDQLGVALPGGVVQWRVTSVPQRPSRAHLRAPRGGEL